MFREYAKYKWGPTITSGELVGIPDARSDRKARLLHGRADRRAGHEPVHVGASVTREELTRDDSLIQYLTLNNCMASRWARRWRADRAGVRRRQPPGQRQLLLDGCVDPFPWVSGSWPVSGPVAFTGRELDRIGVTVTVRTP